MAQARVSFHLGPSKLWWVYLGLRSNPGVAQMLEAGYDHAVLFDEIFRLPPPRPRSLYLFVLWDGLADFAVLERVQDALGPGAELHVLLVGECAAPLPASFDLQPLYPAGALRFNLRTPPLELGSRLQLAAARLKTLTMPVKNLVAGRERLGTALRLLLGRRQIVFCGSYGLTPRVLRALCARYGVDPGCWAALPCRCLPETGRFLAGLLQRDAIPGPLFLALVHLLGRAFVLERIAAMGWPLFVHGYGDGANINVYTTPWYRQHLFLDFGSVVGEGNYPRLADLKFFGKAVFPVDLAMTLPEVLEVAGAGALERHFAAAWEREADALARALPGR